MNTPTPRTQAAIRDWINKGEIAILIDISDELETELAAMTKQRDELAEALQKLADCDWVITLPNRMDAVRTIANEALKCLTNPNEL
jgi:hypothetical protein